MICKKCGAEFDDKYEVCPMCGCPVKEDVSDNGITEKVDASEEDAISNENTIEMDDEETPDNDKNVISATPTGSAQSGDRVNAAALLKNKKFLIGIVIAVVILLFMIASSGGSKSDYSSSNDYSSDSGYETETDTYDTGGIPSGTYNVIGRMTNGVTEGCYGEYITIQGNEAYGSVNGNTFSGSMEYWRSSGGIDVYYISTQLDNGVQYGIAISYKDGTLYRWTEGHVDSENFVAYE